MRNPRPKDFSTHHTDPHADEIDLSGIVPLRPNMDQPTTLKRQLDGMTAHHPDSTLARQHDSLTASRHASSTPQEQIIPLLEQSYVLTSLKQKATQKTTLRLPSELLEKLEEVLYLAKRKHRVRLTMNAIYVATLAFFCQQFEALGDQSPLYKDLRKYLDDLPS